MPLLDHFEARFNPKYDWSSIHTTWASALADHLTQALPERFFAQEHAHSGAGIEIDVAAFEGPSAGPHLGNGTPTTATLARPQTWAPPTPIETLEFLFPLDFEVRVVTTRYGQYRVAGAIELISPSNKDRPESRLAFVVKCANYLYGGAGLIIIDVITQRRANLHLDLLRLLGRPAAESTLGDLYAAAYQPLRRDGREEVDIWTEPLAVGRPLPTLPLALAADLVIPVDFEAAYMDARRRRKLA